MLTRAPIVVALLLVAAACSKTKKPTTTTTAVTPMGDAGRGRVGKDVVPEVGQTDPDGPAERVRFGPVYFEFDSALLTEAGRAELARAADYLARASDRITVEGHTDERGTTEYNLALGQQRASAVAAYLQRLGVPAARIETITYGEERPAVTGEDDGAWTQNRRAEFVLRP